VKVAADAANGVIPSNLFIHVVDRVLKLLVMLVVLPMLCNCCACSGWWLLFLLLLLLLRSLPAAALAAADMLFYRHATMVENGRKRHIAEKLHCTKYRGQTNGADAPLGADLKGPMRVRRRLPT
jgi:hypothetical protein